MEDPQTIGAVIEYLQAFDPTLPATMDVQESAKSLVVVDGQGNATIHKTDPKRTLLLVVSLPPVN